LITCNPASVAGSDDAGRPGSLATENVQVELSILLAVGPEILAGSTRLKAGTATKLALNIISTGTMVMLGKVRGNLMIDLHASSTKLRDRAIRVVAELAGSDYNSARQQLEAANWNLRAVVDKVGPTGQ
jgi:N-acetylmuramic acid 6-phosphate etherase